jgi:chromosome segregation ATPase
VGELEVRRKEITNAIDEAKQEIERLRTAKVENAVQAELLRSEIGDIEANIERMELEMSKLADYIEAEQPLVLKDGSTVSVAQLNEYAVTLVSNYDTAIKIVDSKRQTLLLYEENVHMAEQRATDGSAVIRDLESQLEIIDAQVQALRVFSERPELLVSGGQNDSIRRAQELVMETSEILGAQIKVLKQEDSLTTQPGGAISEALGENQEDSMVTKLRERSGGGEAGASATPTQAP